jgi:hypothetical protein
MPEAIHPLEEELGVRAEASSQLLPSVDGLIDTQTAAWRRG